nr:hypothetical protein [Tanacetum cinerariifolium]
GQWTNPRDGGTAGFRGVQNRVGNANPSQTRQVKCYNCNGIRHIARNCTQPKRPQNFDYYKDKMLQMQAQENKVTLDEEQLLFLAADDCDVFDSDVDEDLMAQTMFMANLSSTDPVNDEARPSYDSYILSEVQDHDHCQDTVCAHHEEHAMHDNIQLNHVVDSHADYTSNSNMIPYYQYVKNNAVPTIHSNVSFVSNDAYMMIDNDMYEPHAQSVSKTSPNTVGENSLTAELTTYKEQVELYERRARQKPYYNELNKVAIGYKNPLCLTRAKQVQHALYNGHEIIKDNHVSAIVQNIELGFTKMYVAHTIVETRCLELEAKLSNLSDKSHNDNHDELVNHFSNLEVNHLNLQLKYQNLKDSLGNIPPTPNKDTPDFDLVFVIGKYDIDVEPIVPRLRNNREAHLDYLRHLKESVETICDIVEEAMVVRPLDSSIISACRYTKHFQELLEYAIGTCPQDSHQRDKKHAPAPLFRKKQVTFAEQCGKSHSNTHKHVAKLTTQKTNVHVPPSTGVNRYTDASRS